jgi:uncharacterized protein YndB with AHSA1/START domain
MAKVEVRRRIGAPPEAVWTVLADVAGHVSWMEDARAITFTTAGPVGHGTGFDCVTVIGPVRLVDHMEITSWEPGRAIAIRHVKPIAGTGRITLAPTTDGSPATVVTWSEDLTLPWWLGGPAGDVVAARILHRVWGRSLANLEGLVEPRSTEPGPPSR